MDSKTIDTGIVNRWLKSLKSNPAALLTLLYFLWMLSSMFQAFFRFDAFGINIFQYATIRDFVLAPLRDPNAFLSVVIMTLVVLIYVPCVTVLVRLQGAIAKKSARLKWLQLEVFPGSVDSWAKGMSALLFVVLIVTGQYLYNARFGEGWKQSFVSDCNNRVRVVMRREDLLSFKLPSENLVLLGTTERFFFLYANEQGNEVSYIVPSENILLLSKQN